MEGRAFAAFFSSAALATDFGTVMSSNFGGETGFANETAAQRAVVTALHASPIRYAKGANALRNRKRADSEGPLSKLR